MTALSWCQLQPVSSIASMPTVIDLGLGESEVIALGIENPGSLLILDDQLGRQIANFHKLKFTETLGVLIKAKQAGQLSTITPLISQLQQRGMWLSDSLIHQILNLAGEGQ